MNNRTKYVIRRPSGCIIFAMRDWYDDTINSGYNLTYDEFIEVLKCRIETENIMEGVKYEKNI